MNKTIAITQRVDFLEDRNERRDSIDQRLINLINMCGLKPITIPNSLINISKENLTLWLSDSKISGIILSGGNNIGDEPDRDKTEACVLDYAMQNDIPVLGICRGMQMLGHYFGTHLKPVKGHVQQQHELSVSPGYNYPESVNSFHDYQLHECPNNFHVTARSADNCIEAIKHNSMEWHGWMWHPERENVFAKQDIENIRGLFNNV